nr:ribonuclease H-like domain-containing protein [Tanacetum cinerariifolium]
MTQRLGDGFEFKKKAFFVCGSFNHLIKDCDFYENKMVKKPVLNNKGKITGPMEIRPVWDNTARVNHQIKLTHPHPKRNFVQPAVLTRSGQVLVNAAKQSSHRAEVSVSAARPKTNNFNEKVNTARINNVFTIALKTIVSAAEGNRDNAVKSSACWIWRPKGNLIDHISKDSGLYTPKRFNYVDPQGRLNTAKLKLVLNGCLDWNETAAYDEIQVSDVGLTYYWLSKAVWMDLFLATSKVKNVNGEAQLQAFVDKKKLIITEASIRRDLRRSKNQGGDRGKKLKFLHQVVLDLEEAKTAQVKEISSLKKKVKKLEQKRKSRTSGFKRLRKVGSARRVESSTEASLGDQEDASKHERMIDNINQDVEITLVDDTQGRMNEEDMFRVNDLDGDEVSTADPVITASKVVTTADCELAARLQEKERRELNIEEKSRLFVELMDKRNKHFARLRAEKIISKPPTKAQKRNHMCTYLKNMANYKQNQLKNKNFKEIQMLFNNTIKWIEAFVSMDTKLVKGGDKAVEGSEKAEEGSSKRAGSNLEQEDANRQRLEEDNESVELKRCLEIIPEDDDDVTIKATPLSSKSPTIVDYKICKKRRKSFFKIIRADGNSQNYLTFGKMFKKINKEYLEVLWSIVKARFKKTKLIDDIDNLLVQTLKTMFEHHVEDNI